MISPQASRLNLLNEKKNDFFKHWTLKSYKILRIIVKKCLKKKKQGYNVNLLIPKISLVSLHIVCDTIIMK